MTQIVFESSSPLSQKLDLLAICVHSQAADDSLFKAVDEELDGALTAQATIEGFTGQQGQTMMTHTGSDVMAKSIQWIGSGDKKKDTPAHNQARAAACIKSARQLSSASVGFVAAPVSEKKGVQSLRFSSEGLILGAYAFSKYMRGQSAKEHPSSDLRVFLRSKGKKKTTSAQTRSYKQAVLRAAIVSRAVCHARDMVNEPAEVMFPSAMADQALSLAKKHKNLKVKVLTMAECEKLGMGMFLAVGKGSDKEPKFVHLTYTPAKKAKKKVALIGKGVTFDSGGYSLKPSAAMMGMKVDMAGSAAVIASMGAIAEIGSPHEVHAVAALCENLVSGRAYKLGDVLTAMDGTTVEINNTDAEGRLTLGDAITYVRTNIKPDEMFDFATLTGACMVALGPYTAGVMSDDEKLVKSWLRACDDAGEKVWRLPLDPQLKKQLKSPIADYRNTGERMGGALTAGLFLQHFAGDTPWVHTDIAGPSALSGTSGAKPRGGTGFGVASIVEYLSS